LSAPKTKIDPAPLSAQAEINIAERNDLTGVFTIFIWGREFRLPLAASLLMIVISSACTMSAAWFLGHLVQLLMQSQDRWQIQLHVWGFLGFEATAIAFQYFGRIKLATVTTRITTKIRYELFRRMTELPISYFDTQPLGRTLTRMTNDVEGIENFFGGTLARILISMIQMMAVLVAMIAVDIRFGLITVAACIPSIIISVVTRTPVREALRVYKRRSAQTNARLAEFLNGLAIIKVFGLERWTDSLMRQDVRALYDAGMRNMHLNSVIRPAVVIFCFLPTLFALWIGGREVLAGTLEMAVLVTFVRFCERFMGPVRTISQEIQLVQEALVSTERVRQMLAEPTEINVLGVDGKWTEAIAGKVEFRDVSLEYLAGIAALKSVSFVAEAGKQTALVGHTGSGKSSTIHLIPQFYPIKRGQILIDDVDIRTFKRSHLRSQIGYVSQDIVVFRGSIRDNLISAIHSDRKTSDEMLMAACERTGLLPTILRNQGGLDFQLLDEGANLSMGERQLIAITRMLLKDPAILILDEATASIDEASEALVQDAIKTLVKGRTCFTIAHRLNTVIDAEQILVYNGGRIIAAGRHAQLLQSCAYYCELVQTQLSNDSSSETPSSPSVHTSPVLLS
jgi:ATP-binding cassette subfamily B multidrug efflux pump